MRCICFQQLIVGGLCTFTLANVVQAQPDTGLSAALQREVAQAHQDRLERIEQITTAATLPSLDDLLSEVADLALAEVNATLTAGADQNGRVGGGFGYDFLPEFLPLLQTQERRDWIDRYFEIADLDTRAASLTWLRGQESAIRLADNGLRAEAAYMLERAADYIGGPEHDTALAFNHRVGLAQGWLAIGETDRAHNQIRILIAQEQSVGRYPALSELEQDALEWTAIYKGDIPSPRSDAAAALDGLVANYETFQSRLAEARTAEFVPDRQTPMVRNNRDDNLYSDIVTALDMGEMDAARHWTQRFRVYQLAHPETANWHIQTIVEARTGDCYSAERAANLMVLGAFQDVARTDLYRGGPFQSAADHNGHSNWPHYIGRQFDQPLLALMECGRIVPAVHLATLPGLRIEPHDRVLSTSYRYPYEDMSRLNFDWVIPISLPQRRTMARALACYVVAQGDDMSAKIDGLLNAPNLVNRGAMFDSDEMRIRLAEGLRAEGLGGLEAYILDGLIARYRHPDWSQRPYHPSAGNIERATAMARLAHALPDATLPGDAGQTPYCSVRQISSQLLPAPNP